MTRFNLNDLSLAELKSLQKDVAKAIAEFSDKRKTEAIAALEAHAKELGFTLSELTGAKKTRKTLRPVGAKYRHPENPEVTWSGRGRPPGWFKAAIAAGKALESVVV